LVDEIVVLAVLASHGSSAAPGRQSHTVSPDGVEVVGAALVGGAVVGAAVVAVGAGVGADAVVDELEHAARVATPTTIATNRTRSPRSVATSRR